MSFSGSKLLAALALFFAIALAGCSVTGNNSTSAGSSVVVLVDFSKSFAPLSNDEQSLEQLSAATSELARQEWQPPVAVLWSRIQTASLVSSPLCGPFQFKQSLIKRENDDSADITKKLEACTQATVSASTIASEQAPYTDISGAIALAAEQGRSVASAKYLVIVSDFVEDLPPGNKPVKFQLSGERVLLLHRMGTERTRLALVDHLARIRRWSGALREAGAASVVALPLNSATKQRIMRALGSGVNAGTDVLVLQDLPDTARPETLTSIATTLSTAARDWESPVTLTWADVRDEPETPQQMPTLEFTPRLIKASEGLSAKEFRSRLNECAEGMKRFSPGAKHGDMAASLSFYASAGALDKAHVVLIISSFSELPKDERGLPLDLTGVKVVMLPAPNLADASDETAYMTRVAQWEKWLRQLHARVCRIPYNGLTTSSLIGCIHE
jgi:hypothetical protein